MSDETKPEDEVPEVDAEAKPGKKAKAAKKKAAEPQAEEAPVAADGPAADEPPPVVEVIPPAEPPAEPETTPEPAAVRADSAQPDRNDDLFQQGVQALLRGEYDAADNFFGQALTLFRKTGDQLGQIDVLEQLGHLCFLRGAEAQAREYYHQAGLMRVI